MSIGAPYEPTNSEHNVEASITPRWPQYSALVVVQDDVRTAELVASLSLATDLAMGLPREHGLESTIIGGRLAGGLGVDDDTASQAYYGSLLYYIGCTADAEISAELFPWGTPCWRTSTR